MGKLDGKVAIVTGSNGGIGRAVAVAFAAEGARVVVNGRRPQPAEETAAIIRSYGGEALPMPGDVATPAFAEELANSAVNKWGTLDILVNNAAISGPIAPIGSDDLDDWMETLRVNVFGLYAMTRAAAAVMQKAGRGKIIDVSSGANRGTAGDLLPYRVSKAAVLRLSTAAAEQLHKFGVEINTVDVFSATPMVYHLATLTGQDPVLAERMKRRTQAGEPTAEDNAGIFVWLASPASDGLYARNFAWNMNTADLDRVKPRLMADPRALRIEMVPFDGIGLSDAARAYHDRLRAN